MIGPFRSGSEESGLGEDGARDRVAAGRLCRAVEIARAFLNVLPDAAAIANRFVAKSKRRPGVR